MASAGWKLRGVPLVGALLFAAGFAASRVAWPPAAATPPPPEWPSQCAATPARPWRAECRFFQAAPLPPAAPYWVCLRELGDPESDAVRSTRRFPRCDSLLELWGERMLPRDVGDVFVDAGAGVGGCSLLLAAAGARVHAVEDDPDRLFRLTSSVLANGDALRVRAHRTLAGVPRDARVRLLRLGDSVDAVAALDALATPAAALWRRVRSVKVESRNATAAAAACRWLEGAGYTLYRGGAPLGRASECGVAGAAAGLDVPDIVAHFVGAQRL